MISYIVRRILQMIPVLLGAIFLLYASVFALGDPASGRCGQRPCPAAYVAKFNAEYNLDKPLWQQYLHYMGQILTGDFGTAFDGQPVLTLMANAFPVTARLTLVAVVIEALAGVALGVLAGLRRGRATDTGVLMLTLVVVSVPTFVSGYLLQYLAGVRWGLVNPSVSPAAPLDELLLPGLVLALVSLAYVTRLTRTSIAENLRADHVRTAVAKGLPRRRVIGRHLLRTSLIPVVTFIGADVGALMGGAVVTERIFNIHGVGYQLYQGILRQNSPTVVGFVTVLVLVFLVANLLVDLLYAVLDPRIRYA